MDLVLLHDGPHESVGDLTPVDYLLLVVALLALVGVGAALWHMIQRRGKE